MEIWAYGDGVDGGIDEHLDRESPFASAIVTVVCWVPHDAHVQAVDSNGGVVDDDERHRYVETNVHESSDPHP
jgi:hypothetical protein